MHAYISRLGADPGTIGFEVHGSVEKSVCQWACTVKPVLFKGQLYNLPLGAGSLQSKSLHLNSILHISFVMLSKLLSFQAPHLYVKLSITTVPSHSSGKYSVNEG